MKAPIRIAACALSLIATHATAETITLEMEDGVLFLRCTDMFGVANCEVILPDVDAMYSCIAFDGSGKPIAQVPTFGDGMALFPELDAELVSTIKCREL